MDRKLLALLTSKATSYGFVLIKKPRVDKFALFSIYKGVMQEGAGFTLNVEDVEDLLNYYYLKYLYSSSVNHGLLRSRYTQPTKPQKTRIELLIPAIQKLIQNPLITGTYGVKKTPVGKMSSSYCEAYGDGYCSKKPINKVLKGLAKTARAANLLLNRYPYPYLFDKDLIDRYVIVNLLTGHIVKKCQIQEVKAFIAGVLSGNIQLV